MWQSLAVCVYCIHLSSFRFALEQFQESRNFSFGYYELEAMIVVHLLTLLLSVAAVASWKPEPLLTMENLESPLLK